MRKWSQQGSAPDNTYLRTIVRYSSSAWSCTHQSLQLWGVLWEAAVVDVRLGCRYPEEYMGQEDTNLQGTQGGGEDRWWHRIHEVSVFQQWTSMRREIAYM
jgi:hypothetical protein